MNENELLKKIADLPREMAPEHDPWDRIEARLENPGEGTLAGSPPQAGARRLSRWAPLAIAAAAVLALVLVIMPAPETARQTQEVAGNASPGVTMPPAVMLSGSEAEYQAAFREFISIGESRERLSPVAVEKIETGWADLRQVELALSDALAQNPNDSFLNRRMLELRARQLGFLRQLAALDHSSRRLTI